MEPAAALTGTLECAEEMGDDVDLSFEVLGMEFRTNAASDGAFRFDTLPRRTGRLRARSWRPDAPFLKAEVEAPPGTPIVVVLRPDDCPLPCDQRSSPSPSFS